MGEQFRKFTDVHFSHLLFNFYGVNFDHSTILEITNTATNYIILILRSQVGTCVDFPQTNTISLGRTLWWKVFIQ